MGHTTVDTPGRRRGAVVAVTAIAAVAAVVAVTLVAGAWPSSEPGTLLVTAAGDDAAPAGALPGATEAPGSAAPATDEPASPAPDTTAEPDIDTADPSPVVGLDDAVVAVSRDPGPALDPDSERLVLRSEEAIAVVEATTGTVVMHVAGGLVSGDRSLVVASTIENSASAAEAGTAVTTVSVRQSRDGSVAWTANVDGAWEAQVVSHDGSTVVLVAEGERPDGLYPAGREHSELAVVNDHGDAHTLTVRGNVAPEAIATDGSAIFVLDYTPALAPVQYEVLRLDLDDETLTAVPEHGVDISVPMAGTARTQVASADGTRLYTLYTVGDPLAGTGSAFVHVLDLDEQWVHCLFLPAPFGSAPPGRATLAASPDGGRLYVASLADGVLAELDTDRLEHTATVPLNTDGGTSLPLVSAVAADGTLYLGHGGGIAAFDTETLLPTRRIWAEDAISALTPATDASGELFVGLHDEIRRFRADGSLRWTVAAPVLGSVTFVGGPETQPRGSLSCLQAVGRSPAPAAGAVLADPAVTGPETATMTRRDRARHGHAPSRAWTTGGVGGVLALRC
jgi:hypothetical protein